MPKTKLKHKIEKQNNREIKYLKLDRIPITAVQKQVGHKKLTTTQIYSNLAPERVREAYEGRDTLQDT